MFRHCLLANPALAGRGANAPQPSGRIVAGIPNTLPPQTFNGVLELGRVGVRAQEGPESLEPCSGRSCAKRAFITCWRARVNDRKLSVVAQYDCILLRGRYPETRRTSAAREPALSLPKGPPIGTIRAVGRSLRLHLRADSSFRLKSGCTQADPKP